MLLPVFGPSELRVYGPQRFKKVKPGRPTKMALAMQLIIIFCNLQQQPTSIKNIKSIICSADPC